MELSLASRGASPNKIGPSGAGSQLDLVRLPLSRIEKRSRLRLCTRRTNNCQNPQKNASIPKMMCRSALELRNCRSLGVDASLNQLTPTRRVSMKEFAPATPADMLKEEFLAEHEPVAKPTREGNRYFSEADR